jgi:RNA polymerase sigma-70 factor, ECF subfamily
LVTFIAHRLGNRAEAQDLTAEVFHQALASLDRFEWRGVPFAGWLLSIASHLLAYHSGRVANKQELPMAELEWAGADEKIERQIMLFQLVDSLPEDQRRVIRRRFLDQRSVREIARRRRRTSRARLRGEEMGRSQEAVKQLQLRALEKLRDKIRSHHG